MKITATLTSKGQVTIPRAVRRLLGLQRGDTLAFEVRPGRVELRPAKANGASAGILKPHLPKRWRSRTVAQMDAAIARHLARQHRHG